MRTPHLSVGAFGKAVGQLHARLTGLGFELPATEVERGFFVPLTRGVVQTFQGMNGLRATGEVNNETTTALERALAKIDATTTQEASRANRPSGKLEAPVRTNAAYYASHGNAHTRHKLYLLNLGTLPPDNAPLPGYVIKTDPSVLVCLRHQPSFN